MDLKISLLNIQDIVDIKAKSFLQDFSSFIDLNKSPYRNFEKETNIFIYEVRQDKKSIGLLILSHLHSHVRRAELSLCFFCEPNQEVWNYAIEYVKSDIYMKMGIETLYIQIEHCHNKLSNLLETQGFKFTHKTKRLYQKEPIELDWYAYVKEDFSWSDPLQGKKVVCFIQSPKAVGGGSIVLMDYSAYLADNYGYDIYFINYANSKLDCFYEESNACFYDIQNCDFTIFEDALFFVPVNYIFYLLARIKNLPNAKICTYFYHPKVLDWIKNGQILKLAYKEKEYKNFLKLLADQHAACFMDKSNYLPVARFVSKKFKESYVPIVCEYNDDISKDRQSLNKEKNIRIGWLGRLDPDKIYSITNFLENTRLLNINKKIDFHIVGDGNARSKINFEKYSDKVRFIFTSYLYGEERNQYLKENCDLCIAMGISATVCGSLGIPTIVPIISDTPFSGNQFVYLFDCPFFSLGWSQNDVEALGLKTYELQEIVNTVFRKDDGQNKFDLGTRCKNYVLETFSLESCAPQFINALSQTQLTVDSCIKCKFISKQLKLFNVYNLFCKNDYPKFHAFSSKVNGLISKNFVSFFTKGYKYGLFLLIFSSLCILNRNNILGYSTSLVSLLFILSCILISLYLVAKRFKKKKFENLREVLSGFYKYLERKSRAYSNIESTKLILFGFLSAFVSLIVLSFGINCFFSIISIVYFITAISFLSLGIILKLSTRYIKTGKLRAAFMPYYLKHFKKKRNKMLARRKEEKIRVLFYVSVGNYWNTFEEIYQQMLKDDRFDPIILAAPQFVKHQMLDYKVIDFLEKKGISYVKVYDEKTQTFMDLRTLKPNYIMTNRCYLTVRPKQYANREIGKFSKIVYIPYTTCMAGGKTMDLVCRFPENKYADFVFLANDWMKGMYEMQQKKEPGSNVQIVASGSPKFDAIYHSLKNKSNEEDRLYKQIVLYTPRWSDFIDNTCSFYILKNYFIDLARNNPDIKFIFRPHPLMYIYMEDKTIWDEYLQQIQSLPNAEIDLKEDYRISYNRATVLVSDLSSMLLEFSITSKPILYYHKKDAFNEFGNSVARGFYFCNSVEDVDHYLKELRAGNDPLLNVRKQVLAEDFSLCDGNSAQRIMDIIYQDYKETIGI